MIKSDQVLTSLSTLELLPRNENDLSCTDERYRGPVDHRDWDQSALNKLIVKLEYNELRNWYFKKLTLRDGQCRRPLVSQDVETNRTIGIDVRMVNLGREADFGGLEWVVRRERDGQEKNASSIRRITLIWSMGHLAWIETMHLRVPLSLPAIETCYPQ